MNLSPRIKRTTIDRLFTVRRVRLSELLLVRRSRFRLSELLIIKKRTLVLWLFYAAIFIAFYTSLTPWFLWRIYRFYTPLACLPLLASMFYARRLRDGLFDRRDFKLPSLTCAVLLIVMAVLSGKNVVGLTVTLFNAVIYVALFKIRVEELRRLGRVLSLSMACLLSLSIPAYFFYLIGGSLPHTHVVPEYFDYSFENYYLFMIDDRTMYDIIPRFHSLFLEPSHLGMACIALLYSQIGQWNTWRCRVLFFTVVITFSLAAYLCLVLMLFSAAWMRGKAVIGKIIALGVIGAGVVVGSIFYNRGDNLVNVLIVQRLTMNTDGELEGDNRTTDLFTKEFNKFASSPRLLVGKGMESMEKFGNGNAGFRVFLYTNGLISFFALVVFFYFLLKTSPNRRAAIAMLLISITSFIPHAIPVKYYFFIPLYILLFSEVYPGGRPRAELLQTNDTKNGSN